MKFNVYGLAFNNNNENNYTTHDNNNCNNNNNNTIATDLLVSMHNKTSNNSSKAIVLESMVTAKELIFVGKGLGPCMAYQMKGLRSLFFCLRSPTRRGVKLP